MSSDQNSESDSISASEHDESVDNSELYEVNRISSNMCNRRVNNFELVIEQERIRR